MSIRKPRIYRSFIGHVGFGPWMLVIPGFQPSCHVTWWGCDAVLNRASTFRGRTSIRMTPTAEPNRTRTHP